MRTIRRVFAGIACLALAAPLSAWAAPASPRAATVLEAAKALQPGQYIWAPDIAPDGPVLLIVSLASQRATLYRNGIPIAISTISSGKDGHETPTGVFTILQRRIDHRSNLYNNAPMPYMQRLTWSGVALHGGALPGYPASHGCIRLPRKFAQLLYGVTALGMTVIVTRDAAVPHIAPDAKMKLKGGALPEATNTMAFTPHWSPEKAPDGPVSIVISTRDRQMMVLRNGVVIGAGPVVLEDKMDAALRGTTLFVLRDGTKAGANAGTHKWVQVALPGAIASDAPLDLFRGGIRLDDALRAKVESVLKPGTSVIIAADSLDAGTLDDNRVLMEDEEAAPPSN
ncbi:L,D-transpeptidase [Pseudonocardia sp. TMWB2A]|uniref:L,D-transpeptidase n=1 Tax=Pseudonocardia sp. TMWB2A TaxID=687430 RepID=UPI00307F2714